MHIQLYFRFNIPIFTNPQIAQQPTQIQEDVPMQQQPTVPGQYNHGEITLGEWMLTLLIAAIPIVGFVMLFVWGFGSGTNPSKANWAKAALLWMAILFAVYFLIFMVFGLALLSGR